MVPVLPARFASNQRALTPVPRSTTPSKHVEAEIGHRLRHHALAVREESLLKPPVAVKDLRDEVRLGDLSEVCNPRVGTHQIDQPNTERAERERRIGMEFGADAELARRLDNRLAARQLLQLDRRCVVADLEGPPQGGDAVVLLIVVFGAVGELTGAVGQEERRIEDGVGRREAMLEGGQIDEWFEGRSTLKRRLDRTVELAALKIETTDQGENRSRAVVHRDQRALDLRLLEQVHDQRLHCLLGVLGPRGSSGKGSGSRTRTRSPGFEMRLRELVPVHLADSRPSLRVPVTDPQIGLACRHIDEQPP